MSRSEYTDTYNGQRRGRRRTGRVVTYQVTNNGLFIGPRHNFGDDKPGSSQPPRKRNSIRRHPIRFILKAVATSLIDHIISLDEDEVGARAKILEQIAHGRYCCNVYEGNLDHQRQSNGLGRFAPHSDHNLNAPPSNVSRPNTPDNNERANNAPFHGNYTRGDAEDVAGEQGPGEVQMPEAQQPPADWSWLGILRFLFGSNNDSD